MINCYFVFLKNVGDTSSELSLLIWLKSIGVGAFVGDRRGFECSRVVGSMVVAILAVDLVCLKFLEGGEDNPSGLESGLARVKWWPCPCPCPALFWAMAVSSVLSSARWRWRAGNFWQRL